MHTPTQSAETHRKYLARARQLIDRYEAETGKGWRSNPMNVAIWLTRLKPGITTRTWYQYKAAMVAFMTENGPASVVSWLQSQTSEGCKPRKQSRQSSAVKMKRLSDEDLHRILKELRPEQSAIDEAISYLLALGREVGLRPQEWGGARLDGDWMIVRNAKRSNGRSFGEFRRIGIAGLAPYERAMIQRLITLFEQYGDPERLVKLAGMRMWRITRKLWPNRKKHPTLYSARHQFSANAKASGLTLPEISALMGHGVTDTVTTHYAKRRSSQGMIRVAPHPEDVAAIKEKAVSQNRPAAESPPAQAGKTYRKIAGN